MLDALEAGVLDNARSTGQWLADAVRELNHPLVDHVRGHGMLLGVVLTGEVAARVADAALDAGFIINAPRPYVLRLAPPLIATPEDLQPFVDALPGLLASTQVEPASSASSVETPEASHRA